jgi:hypothetical protein
MPSTEHLLHWKSNKDGLNGFADRVARLKNDLTSLLSQQAVPHPGKHSDYLAQIESRLAENRSFYATIRDANEEIAEAFLSNQGGGASARLVSSNPLSAGFSYGLLGPGRQPLEATGRCGGGGRHSGYRKRSKENHSDDLEASREDVTGCESENASARYKSVLCVEAPGYSG